MNKVSTLNYTFKLFLCLNMPNVALFFFVLKFYPLFRAYFLGALIFCNKVTGKKWLATRVGLIFLQVAYEHVARMSEIQANVG